MKGVHAPGGSLYGNIKGQRDQSKLAGAETLPMVVGLLFNPGPALESKQCRTAFITQLGTSKSDTGSWTAGLLCAIPKSGAN